MTWHGAHTKADGETATPTTIDINIIATHCRTVDGTGTTHVGNRQIDSTITNFTTCEGPNDMERHGSTLVNVEVDFEWGWFFGFLDKVGQVFDHYQLLLLTERRVHERGRVTRYMGEQLLKDRIAFGR